MQSLICYHRTCYPGSKLPWLENMHRAQHLAISIRSSNNVKITNSSDRYHKWFMIFFCIASIILLWCIVTGNTFYAQADKPTNAWQSMVEGWQEGSLRSTEHVLTWGACTEHVRSMNIQKESWHPEYFGCEWWTDSDTNMYSADIDKMPRSELFEWNQFSWLEQVSGFLDHCVLASQHFRDISQSVSTVICNPPLARLLSACECQPRVKLR